MIAQKPPLESRIVKKTLERLRQRGGFWMKIHGSPVQLAGVPDIIGCYRGRFVSFEVKRPGNDATPLQKFTMGKVRAAGGIAALTFAAEEVDDYLDKIDRAEASTDLI